MRRPSVLAVALALWVACEPRARHSPAAGGPQSTAAASAIPNGAATPETIEPLAGFVCELEGRALGDGARLPLYASQLHAERGAAMGSVAAESTRLRLTRAESDGVALAEVDGYGLAVAGLVRLRDLSVYVRPARRLAGGMITPGQGLSARLARVDAEEALVTIASFSLLDPELLPLEERVRCDDLLAAPGELSGAPAGRAISLDASEGLEVLPSPTSTAGTGLNVVSRRVDGLLAARELERALGRARVEIASPEGAVTGWVDAEAVGDSLGPTSAPQPAARRSPAAALGQGERRSCAKELSLAARVDSTLYAVGRARAGTPLVIVKDAPADDGWRRVELAAFSGESYAREAELAACAPSD